MWHRQNWDILYPHVDLVEVELESLELRSGIVIGSIDPSIEGHTELYDLFINGENSFVYLVCIHAVSILL